MMKTQEYFWRAGSGWKSVPSSGDLAEVDLVLVFGGTEIVKSSECIQMLHGVFSEAIMIGCTTGGEIYGTTVHDDVLVAVAVSFTSSKVAGSTVAIGDYSSSEEAAKALIENIPQEGLRHVFVLADGVLTSGSDVVRGLNHILPADIPVTGGLAGDGMDFSRTYVIYNGEVHSGSIAAVGFYGEALRIGIGSCGGWKPYGPQRMITSSKANTMYELEGQSVLDLYKKYLGPDAENLPASGLLFPLSLTSDDEEAVVRTVKSVDEENKSLSFAGDVPTGSYAQFMRAVPDDLIDGAAEAAEIARKGCGCEPELCILISCIGRKAVLKQLTEEEIEAVEEKSGGSPCITGFYSYGEIAPFRQGYTAILHNQTMTITALTEVDDASVA